MGSGGDVFISWDFWVLELTLLCKKGAEVVSWGELGGDFSGFKSYRQTEAPGRR